MLGQHTRDRQTSAQALPGDHLGEQALINPLMLSWSSLMLVGGGVVFVMMFVLWIIHLQIKNAAIVDVGWAAGLGFLAIFYSLLGTGWSGRHLLIGTMGGVWSARLALHLLFARVFGHTEEGRYQELRRRWKTNLPLKFLAFFEVQALLEVVLSAPFLVMAINPNNSLSRLEWAGAALWAISIAGEAAADAQLAAFKRRPENRTHICQQGLWRYSRHPNYFFEALIWIAFSVTALGSPHGYVGLIAPALIIYFLVFATGIPATEQQALRSHGAEYQRYQQTTSAFIPWIRKLS